MTFEWYFQKQLTIAVIWAKYEEIRNFLRVSSHSRYLEELAPALECNVILIILPKPPLRRRVTT